MAQQNYNSDKEIQAGSAAGRGPEDLDAATKSLSEALRVSFVILKIIMLVLVVGFLASGFRTVGSDEQALVLRFGRIRGVGEERVLGPGLHWVFPYPIDEIIRIPVAKKVNLPINSFWYAETVRDLLGEGSRSRVPEELDPEKDGYCITRSQEQTADVTSVSGSDYNIVHCKWQLTYKIDDPELFFRNIYVDLEKIPAGQNYADVITQNVTGLLEYMTADAVVTALVNYTIDDVMFEHVARVTEHVRRLLQEKLDSLESGIKVVSVQMTDKTWPRQVDAAFQAAVKASQDSQKAISDARTYAEKTLNKATGPVAEKLFAALQDGNIAQEQTELLWSELAGTAQKKIDEARAYQREVVETARANADYLRQILPEYRKRPELVARQIYWDAIQRILSNPDAKFIIQPAEGAKRVEIRVLTGRDPRIKPRAAKE
jgi:regulator of protease activity HflC (stomatin/prohibitin superfamily)